MLFKPRRSLSIATRLFLSATLCSFVILLIAGVSLSAVYRRITVQGFDERLDVYVRALVADIAGAGQDEAVQNGRLGEPQFELPLSGWYWQITRLDQSPPQIQTSPSLFAERLPRLEVEGEESVGSTRSANVTGPDGQRLRMLQRIIDADKDGVFLVQVAAVTSETEDRIWRFELSLTATFVLLALALAGVTTVQVRFGLRPLRRLQYGVAAIRRGAEGRIEGAFSYDLAPLAAELNLLLAWNRDIVERAQTHVGNLAHALKTPLSVIINEAAENPSSFGEIVREQAQAMRDQIAYYLNRARAAARVNPVGAATEVKPALAGLTRTFEKIYADKELTFDTACGEGARARAERQDLEEMLGNLVDNACKWARSRVSIRVASDPPEEAGDSGQRILIFTIDDDGAGLPESQRQAALARGHRLDESKPGSGLGLSIVADLAVLHGGQLSLDDSPEGGLRATLRLPAA